jgi:DNA repair exonuclease SbcCD ATPase subunit
MKNFMSIGNVTQSLSFDDQDLVLVLGENLDLGGNDSRNGVGKSSIVNALSYALFGVALTNIRKDNLINKTNNKGMVVTLDFESNGKKYHIERGRKPAVFKFQINDKDVTNPDSDESQGESRLTQQEIEKTLGFSHTMFKHIVALNTYTEPFLSLKTGEQREIIEQLLGITKLSEKAEVLKELIRETKDNIKEAEFKIKALQEANRRTEESTGTLQRKASAWETSHARLISDLSSSIEKLYAIDIETEIVNQRLLEEISQNESKQRAYQRELASYEKQRAQLNKQLAGLVSSHEKTETCLCPTCDQAIDAGIKDKLSKDYELKTAELTELVHEKDISISELNTKIDSLNIPDKPDTFYDSLDSAYNHKSSLETLVSNLEKEMAATNPFVEQVELLKNSIQEIDFTAINDLTSKKDHQEFLLKLLTSKDSFIRKKIIDQNLSYLNKRLDNYLSKIGLPHSVKFMSNLEVEITEHGRELDFDNLSRGERTRLILSLSWAFRDVFESLNSKINLLFIDELLDSGMDTQGMESSLAALKSMVRDNKRNIFLISHREELIGRVDSILKVVKEGGFTSIEISSDNPT